MVGLNGRSHFSSSALKTFCDLLLHQTAMSTRVFYCKIVDETIYVKPSRCNMAGYLSENSKEAVSQLFAGALKTFVWIEEFWESLQRVSPDMSLENTRLLVIIPCRTSGDYIV